MHRIYYVWLSFFGLLSTVGCLAGPSEEAEHHVAAHMPRNFPAAAMRLSQLHDNVMQATNSASQELRTPGGRTTPIEPLTEIYDIARWLPGLAADSDLPEEPWERARLSAEDLESILAPLTTLGQNERLDAYRDQAPHIEKCIDRIAAIAEDYSAETNESEDDPS